MKTITEMRQGLAEKAAGDESFRTSLMADPKAVIAKEYGLDLAKTVKIAVHEDSATTAHLILPPSPRLTAEDLVRVSGGRMVAGGITGAEEVNNPHDYTTTKG